MTLPQALAAVVSGEDAAIFAYSVAGAHVAGGGRRKALAGLDAHRSNRDRASAGIVAASATPPGAAAAYELPVTVDSPDTARELMALVDNRLVGLYADLAEASTGPDRRWAARAGAECAMRAVAWGAAPQAFPTGSSAAAVTSAGPSPSAG